MDKIPFDPYDFFAYLSSGFFLIIGAEFTLGYPQILFHDLSSIQLVMLILASYVCGQIIASTSKTVLQDVIIRRILGAPDKNLLLSKPPLLRGIIFSNYYKPVPSVTRNVIAEYRDKITPKDDELFYRIRFSKELQSNDLLNTRLAIFLKQYGFARNLSFVCLLLGIGIWVHPSPNLDPSTWKYGLLINCWCPPLLPLFEILSPLYVFELFMTYARMK